MFFITRQAGRTAMLLSELASDIDRSEIVGIFLSNLPPKIRHMAEYLSTNRLNDLAQIAHQIAGVACGYGFPAISHAARRVEERAQDNVDLIQIRRAVDELKRLCRQAVAGAVADEY